MQFDRQKLIEAVKRADQAARTRHGDELAARETAYLNESTEWVAKHLGSWQDALPRLTKLIESHEPIRYFDLPGGSSHSQRVTAFNRDTPPQPEYRADADLVVLANVLDLLEDDKVTAAQLRTLGVSATMLRSVLELIPR